jgi:N,N'-diacetyllegionaminate synthase
MKQIKIKNHIIAKDKPPFIIAEAGINHNGEMKNALKMIKIAKTAGAHAIKFQTYTATEMISNKKLKYSYKSQGKKITESMLEMFQRCEFSKIQWHKIKKNCDKNQIMFLSTPQNPTDLNLLLEIKIHAIKIGSDDFTNLSLIKNFSQSKLPIILSCGMSTLKEIKTTLSYINYRKYPVVLLLTTSEYPTYPQNANLLKFNTISKIFPDLVLGYSDHTIGNIASSIAVGFGARVFEKHFTLDNNLPGPDHWFSTNPNQLKDWINSINIAYKSLGNGKILPTNNELKMKKIARRCPVTLKNINKGDILDENNVGLRRIGDGLEAKIILKIHGKKAKRKILKGKTVRESDF